MLHQSLIAETYYSSGSVWILKLPPFHIWESIVHDLKINSCLHQSESILYKFNNQLKTAVFIFPYARNTRCEMTADLCEKRLHFMYWRKICRIFLLFHRSTFQNVLVFFSQICCHFQPCISRLNLFINCRFLIRSFCVCEYVCPQNCMLSEDAIKWSECTCVCTTYRLINLSLLFFVLQHWIIFHSSAVNILPIW